ncbi:alpha/beta fold hydrolase [Nocardia sp. NBC_00511]|uniref:alpha/beta fold hydrolase n=1 Tax=Nocardia sp. NBC_00511 TaxID=2903591 RepID=UPI0030E14A97
MSITHTIATSASRRVTVDAEDGVALSIREYGPRHAALTVVLLHGHCSRTESWSYVRDALRRRYPEARVICYDHRGHGDSATAPRHTYTLEQLGRDLHDVLDVVAPTGPVILVGHSMGGMTALTYVDLYPHEIGTRIVGVGLVATAASGLAETGFGRLLRNPAIAAFRTAVRWAPALMQNAKHLARKLFTPIVRNAERGDRTVGPRILALANAIHNQTSIVTMAAFLAAFTTYNRTAALPLLSAIPTLILCGSADLMTPPSHSVAMASAINYADLVLIDGAGHSVILEEPDRVADAVTRLVGRAYEMGQTTHRGLVAVA